MAKDLIRIRGASQNNLKKIDLDLPLGELIVITGVSGSGKSSLAFDTIYAEGQRRYVETFSPYARQFLDRMDRPRIERIDGIPPAVAIDQTNPVRTSRSTVGTMTELNDHIKLLFARAARLFCAGCGREVERDHPESIFTQLCARFAEGTRIMVNFPLPLSGNLSAHEIEGFLASQGYTRVQRLESGAVEVVQDRTRLTSGNRDRVIEALELALKYGRGQVKVYPLDDERKAGAPLSFSAHLHCPDCDIHYREPAPNQFSFNSPLGACTTCRGFGRVIGIDWALVIPDAAKSLLDGAVKPFQTDSAWECQEDLMRYAAKRKIPTDVPWRHLSHAQQQWVIQGEGAANGRRWYGVQRFFEYLESKAYKMHVRVLLSKYRAYNVCPACGGARLQDQALLWRLGTRRGADRALPPTHRFRPASVGVAPEVFATLPGLGIHDLMCLPISQSRAFMDELQLAAPLDQAADLLLGEIRSRLRYLTDVGLDYLTLDRQSRTLSGGEVQRINLTTALGTSLVNTLFVLDEPSIGLHPRDMRRVISVLRRLRDAGNTLLVVEHDPEVMLAADRIIDMGPGPGDAGGRVMFSGSPAALLRSDDSLTGAYLAGRTHVAAARIRHPLTDETDYLSIFGAAEHNLKDLDVRIPLNRLVCVTGVSGSGKSTLVHDILYNALSQRNGTPREPAGRHRRIDGQDRIDAVVLVDQSPIGRTSRANPASYVGALDGIRKLFSRVPLAKERGYTAGTFSFNSGNGRCPTCGGSGFEHVEMQFLSDVYLRCPDCNGTRYRRAVLEVKLGDLSIADVLALTVSQAMTTFGDHAEIRRALEPLESVGLGYVALGQPVPTLSGGEAQRLKLAGHLSKRRSRRKQRTLFLFDEPTTGLHFADISVLLQAFERLLRSGQSLVVIEHNLDVISAADWLIDLGPGGGAKGGEVVAQGTPQQVAAQQPASHTGRALRRHRRAARRLARQKDSAGEGVGSSAASPSDRSIHIVHAREHNLKNISLRLPRDTFTVITGVSGSGKSTLAFDILFNEGQRRYLESLNAYARQFVQPAARPAVDAIYGIPPTVAIEQRTSRGGYKSTVGTLTEIHHFLRLLFVKLGVQYCPQCAIPIRPQSRGAIAARISAEWSGRRIAVFAPLVIARKGYYTDLAKWALRKGHYLLRVDGEPVSTDPWPRLDRYSEHNIDLPIGEIELNVGSEPRLRDLVDGALAQGKGTLRLIELDADGTWNPDATNFSTLRACPGCGRSFEPPDPRLFSYNSKHGWCPKCFGTGMELVGFDPKQTGEEGAWLTPQVVSGPCPGCEGTRLRTEALAVYFRDRSIADYSAYSVNQVLRVLEQIELDDREQAIGQDLIAEISARLRFLQGVGLGYLSLNRAAPTLSGGEAQRIRLAAQLGSNLRGVCYILDEPTIGLHPRDNRMLLDTLSGLEGKGNTIVVVEHDEETIRRAEHLVDLGPGAGAKGGALVAQGTLADLMANPASLTGRSLIKPVAHPIRGFRRSLAEVPRLGIEDAYLHNLKRLHVRVPLARLVCVTGVSGSGKSTLVREILYRNVKTLLAGKPAAGQTRERTLGLRGCQRLSGWEAIDRVLEVDQSPIGKTPRSCPATYIGFWDHIRKLFAATPEARLRGYSAGRFSFNTQGGRCDVCEGQGYKRIEMSFLPDVKVPCESCGGARFNPETLSIDYKRKTIGEVLAMSVDQAADHFAAHASLLHALTLLQDVGLGYISLGQQSPTLSGGEAQRIKLVAELAKTGKTLPRTRHVTIPRATLYVLDEPTIGLHMADVARLTQVLHRLVDSGNSVVVIEHNLDVIAEADWIIDLGPEGGDDGGQILMEGAPDDLARTSKASPTGDALRAFFARQPPQADREKDSR